MAKRKVGNPADDLLNKAPSQEVGKKDDVRQTDSIPENSKLSTHVDFPASGERADLHTPQKKELPEWEPLNNLVVPKEKEERRTSRQQLLFRPSVVKQAKAKSKRMGISLNEAVNQLLEKWVELD